MNEKDYVQAMMMVGRGLAGMLMCNLSHIVRLLFLACMNCRYIYRASSCMIKDLLNQIQCCVLISQEVGSLSVTDSHSADQPTDLSLFGIQKTTVFSQFCVVRRVKCPGFCFRQILSSVHHLDANGNFSGDCSIRFLKRNSLPC